MKDKSMTIAGIAIAALAALSCPQSLADGTSDVICVSNVCFPAESIGELCVGGICLPPTTVASGGEEPVMDAYEIAASADGYMPREQFLHFLRGAASPEARDEGETFSRSPLAFLARRGWFLTLLLIFAAGMALNLTPCVLPMIPVQLAILGIGHGHDTATSKREGLVRGVIYGSAMAVSYGLLGALVVRSGGFFGTLQSSPWFNLAVAALFILLSLALFDVIYVDFSRLGRYRGKTAGLAAVFATGALDALLAGSCVAPALLAVLVLAGALYAEGHAAAIALPFILGLGMGFPWPFIAAGLASLPKPGAWMKRVKWVFGIIVILLAIYFANLASAGFISRKNAGEVAESAETIDISQLHRRLAAADLSAKPALLDFWATWCRNCSAMERVTFRAPDVAAALARDFTLIRVQAENPADPETARILREFRVVGVPAFRVIRAKDGKSQNSVDIPAEVP